jgi:hypothetical protein
MWLAFRTSVLVAGAALGTFGCQRARVADPSAVVAAYADATRRGDSEAVYRLLSQRARRDLGREGTRRLVLDAQKELAAQASYLVRPEAKPEAVAVIRYADGEEAELALEEGVFLVSSAASLPSSARTPSEALSGLRQALARRSYAAMVRVLSAETRGALESDVSAIVRGLEDPETLEVEVEGDEAQVDLPGGHVVKLKREAGVWRVEDLR